MQLLEKITCRLGLRGGECEIGKRGGPHRGRTGGAAELCEHDRNLSEPAISAIAAKTCDTLRDKPAPYCHDIVRRRTMPYAIGIPLLAERPAQGVPEHLPDVFAWKLRRVHGGY